MPKKYRELKPYFINICPLWNTYVTGKIGSPKGEKTFGVRLFREEMFEGKIEPLFHHEDKA